MTSEFLRSVEEVLSKPDEVGLIHVRHAEPQVDSTPLKQLIHIMARKIQLQELEIQEQADAIVQLRHEMAAIRGSDTDSNAVRNEMRRLHVEVETMGAQQRIVLQKMETLGSTTNDLQSDVSRLRFSHQQQPQQSGSSKQLSLAAPAPTHAQSMRKTNSSSSFGAAGGGGFDDVESHQPPPPQVRPAPTSSAGGAGQGANNASHSSLTFIPAPSQAVAIGTPAPASTPASGKTSGKTTPSAAVTPSNNHAAASSSSGGGNKAMAGLELTDTTTGARVTAVKPGGPADNARIEVGEYILKANTREVHRKSDFVGFLKECNPGQCVTLVHRREGQPSKTSKMFVGLAKNVTIG